MKVNRILDHPEFQASLPAQTFRSAPLGFVDVGARGGVHEVVEPLAGMTAILGFEPDREEAERLRAEVSQAMPWARFEMHATALGHQAGRADFYLLTAPTNHSFRPPNRDFTRRYRMAKWEVTGVLPLETAPLDDILFGSRSSETFWGEFLKLDTQGTEYEILQGARRTLAERTVAVITEVEFFQVYEGQRLFSEVELLLRDFGFSFYGFASLNHRSCRQLDKRREAGRERAFYSADAVFFKDPLPGSPFRGELSPRQQHALFVCALLTDYFDFALELALKTWASGAEAERIERLVRFLAASPVRHSYDEVLALAERVRATPENANVEVGRFVDRFRKYSDFQDIGLGRSV